ncbi:MAG: leucine--tRNA ligase, partial [bacterium]
YKWTQWLFLKLYEHGLVYRDYAYVNWCPSCKTVLANEQVIDGACWRCYSVVSRRKLEQWFIRITAYAERLLNDIDKIKEWPDNIRTMQRNWIGRSYGSEFLFQIEGKDLRLPVFTTRPDTIFGVTFVVIAPDHDLIDEIIKLSPNANEVSLYVERALLMSERERTFTNRPKTGIRTGLYVINPLSGERVELWVGDYVLASYGTGVVMGVPAHDQRDFEFAKRMGLNIKVVVAPSAGEFDTLSMEHAFEEPGIMVNSGEFSGLSSEEGGKRVTEYASAKGFGGFKVSYKLRDWLISRQRFWGAPIPMIHCERCGIVPVPEKELPVLLPPDDNVDFIPKGRSPLADIPKFINTICPRCGGNAHRDPDTMDTFMCSSWYHLRYLDPKNTNEPFSKENAQKWMPIDLYIGGAEHATGHLIYFRFITKFLYDIGYLPFDEPAVKLFNHGMVLDKNGEVMSKSKGNVVSPVNLMETIGVDASRVSIFFFAPPEREILWSEESVKGATRFLDRVYRVFVIHSPGTKGHSQLKDAEKPILKLLHRTIRKVKDDIENMRFNTAIARLMEFLNEYEKEEKSLSDGFRAEVSRCFAKLLAPFAPHLAEEIWQRVGDGRSIFLSRFVEYDPELAKPEKITIPVQINGKVRYRVEIETDCSKDEAISSAQENEILKKYVKDKKIKNIIWVPNRLINFVVE